MKIIRCNTFTGVMLLLISMNSALGLAPHQEGADYLSRQSQIDASVEPYVAMGDFHGVVAVQRDGETPLIKPYGLASVELGVPHESTDIFMIGSVSKQFTAVAILLLEQEGVLNTTDRVSVYLPKFRHGSLITIEQLLTHTSGIADIYSLKRFGETAGQGGTFAEIIDDLGKMELTAVPGSTYSYSNGGYALLAAIIEVVAGMPYGEYLDSRIFKPLGMLSTSHDGPGPAAENRVPGYDPWGSNRLTPANPISAAFTAGSGSLWSSAADLLAWSAALHGGRLLGEASYGKLINDYGNGYGYGVSVFERFGRKVIGHDGRVSGYASDLARYLDDRTTIVILSNVQSVARDRIRRAVAAVTFGEPVTPTRMRPKVQSKTSLAELVGVYAFGSHFKVSITAANGRLLARANEGGYSELIPLGETEWFSRMLYATVRFARDETGAVDRLIWGRGEGAPAGHRISER